MYSNNTCTQCLEQGYSTPMVSSHSLNANNDMTSLILDLRVMLGEMWKCVLPKLSSLLVLTVF